MSTSRSSGFHPDFHILILAAGGSSRMGQPKQMLPIGRQQTLLQRVCEVCQACGQARISVVLGSHAAEIGPTVENMAHIIYHSGWEGGMGSSLATGVSDLLQRTNPESLMVVLGDQATLTADGLSRLVETFDRSPRSIVVSDFGAGTGPPVIFARRWLPHLLELSGDEGARPLIRAYPEEVHRVSLIAAGEDIDTPEDYARIKAQISNGTDQP